MPPSPEVTKNTLRVFVSFNFAQSNYKNLRNLHLKIIIITLLPSVSANLCLSANLCVVSTFQPYFPYLCPMQNFDKNAILFELKFRSSRSSGPGGQSVNKLETRVELLLDVLNSKYLTSDQKEIILTKLANRINNEGILQISSDETRSQLKNKNIVIGRLFDLLEEALKPVKKRKPTKPSRTAIEKRLKGKRIKSDKKDLRKPPEI